jgi:hypothetical protein
MVMVESAKRAPTHVLIRGDFERKGEAVEPGVPAFLRPLPKDGPPSRLTLAQWLVDRDNPLAARVQANRLWKQHFGAGLVRTPDDFGTLGEPPTHPELLDYLAVELRENGWDIKSLQRMIVLSATYRQSSYRAAKSPGQDLDPENRLLWRQNRFRLPAENVRDNALAASGLLNHRIGGPSVFPYQPTGYFGDKGRWTWAQSSGDDLYRRGLYTFWRRTTFYPSFQIFDAPSRESCTADRPRTNTPLQALVTLNDPAFVESASVLAQRIMTQGGKTTDDKLTFAVRTVLSRPPTAAERTVLSRLYQKQVARYASDPKAAEAVTHAGEHPALPLDTTEVAAWTAIAGVLLNLDENLNRE